MDHGIPAECDVTPTVCPGFSMSLPPVVETVLLRPSWLKGYMVQHVGGDVPPAAFDAQNMLEGAVNLHQAAEMKRQRDEAEAKANHGR